MLELKLKKITSTAITPTKAHDTDACFDIYANSEAIIRPNETVLIHTGFATDIPHGYWGAVFARSGMATKRGLRPANCVAVIDESYRGEWLVALHNDSDEDQAVHIGDKIAQFTLLPYFDTKITEVGELNNTERGAGGFGSSGM